MTFFIPPRESAGMFASVASLKDIMVKGLWTKEQVKLAFHLYCQLPYGRIHGRNPDIVALAKVIGRTAERAPIHADGSAIPADRRGPSSNEPAADREADEHDFWLRRNRDHYGSLNEVARIEANRCANWCRDACSNLGGCEPMSGHVAHAKGSAWGMVVLGKRDE
jgi:hypothetical protein